MSVLADSTSYVDWPSMWKILLISVGAGAGLVAVYALGIRALSASGYLRGDDGDTGTGAHAASHGTTTRQRNVLALLAAVLCLAIVVGAAVYGIHVMLAKG